MASFPPSRYFLAVFMLNLCLKAFTEEQVKSFAFKKFVQDPSFAHTISMYGDANVSRHNTSIQIACTGGFSAGRVIYKKPFNLLQGKPGKMMSFSVYFVFSISGENGEGLAFFMVPSGYPFNDFHGGSMGFMFDKKEPKFLAVEFDTFKDDKYGDLNSNHVGIDVDSFESVQVSNVSSLNLELNSGDKFQAWIDYQASSSRIEVRLERFGGNRPLDPFLWHAIDLSEMWKEKGVVLGLSSASGNSSQKCNVYSWSFSLRDVPHWMHSEPMNPESFVEKGEKEKVGKRNDCSARVVAALIFAMGCGALVAFVVVFVWTFFGNRHHMTRKELAAETMEFECKKFSIVDKALKDGKS